MNPMADSNTDNSVCDPRHLLINRDGVTDQMSGDQAWGIAEDMGIHSVPPTTSQF